MEIVQDYNPKGLLNMYWHPTIPVNLEMRLLKFK